MSDDNCGDCARCAREHREGIGFDGVMFGRILNEGSRMFLCPLCGNKRCPKASDHRNRCTWSNEPGQPGSRYQ